LENEKLIWRLIWCLNTPGIGQCSLWNSQVPLERPTWNWRNQNWILIDKLKDHICYWKSWILNG